MLAKEQEYIMLKTNKLHCDLCVVGGGMAGVAAQTSVSDVKTKALLPLERL